MFGLPGVESGSGCSFSITVLPSDHVQFRAPDTEAFSEPGSSAGCSFTSAGIVVESNGPGAIDVLRSAAPAQGARIVENTLVGNGTGVSVLGGVDVEVARNVIEGGRVAIGMTGTPVPSAVVAVTDNTLTGYSEAGLKWDLIGVGICFSRNVDPSRRKREPVTNPPLLQTLFPCVREPGLGSL